MTTDASPVRAPATAPREGPAMAAGAIVFLAALGVRLWLIHTFPVIFGGDSIVRLANSDRILLSYQLPLLQAIVHGLAAWSNDPLAVRYLMALSGAAAGLAFYALACSLLGRTLGLQAALFFASSPFILAFSIVPYQEILMLAGLFAAFYFAFDRRWIAASLCLALACLTRYEAWLACPVLMASFLHERGFRPLEIGRAALLFGWAPLGWIAFHGGVTPEGTYAAEASFSLERLFRYVYLGWITVKNTPPPVLLLAAFGVWAFWRQGLAADRRYRMLAAFVALFLIGVLLSAHGERDQPERFVTAREAHILLAAAVLLAGIGLRMLPRYRWVFVVASCLVGLWMAYGFVANETSQPPLALSLEIARYLDEHVELDESVVVLAQPLPRDMLARYLDQAERSGGPAGRERAIALLLGLDNSPPNYQRILVHSRLTKARLQSMASLPGDLVPQGAAPPRTVPDWVVTWSDFRPTNADEEELRERTASQTPEQSFERGGLRVEVHRLR